MDTTDLLLFEIIINVLISSFRFISILILLVYDYYIFVIHSVKGIDFKRHNLTSVDVKF